MLNLLYIWNGDELKWKSTSDGRATW